ncbi:MAG: OmpA family protein [Labilithrix sp.]|nr:OmpA family protein [Labilithrix sp.]
MAFNIIEAVEAQVTPDTVDRIAGSTGESPPKARAATSAGVLAIITGLIQRGSNRSGAAGLLSTLQSPALRGGNLATGLLGDRADALTDSVASSSGVSRGAASGVMSALLPLAAGVLGREVLARKLDAGGLSDFLQSQKQHLTAHPNLPRGLSDYLGKEKEKVVEIEGQKDVGVYPTSLREARPHAVHAKKSSLGPLVALAIGALLLGAILFALGRRPPAPQVSRPEPPPVEAPVAGRPEIPKAPEPVGKTEITGAAIEKPKTDELSSHFKGTAALPDRFKLPNVNFQYATLNMTEGGKATVDELASLMKENPSSRVRLTGYTDAAGDDAVNVPLSRQRAAAVKAMLVERGVDAARIETEGKGEADPIAPNDTKDGRAENRRIEASILQR